MTKLRISLACILLTLLAGCDRVVFEWQGPTDNFRNLDANSDGAVDRFEWEKMQGSVFRKTQGFRYADCDSNGRMSWHEYFVGYMHSNHCAGRYLYEPPPPPPAADTGVAYAYSAGDDWPDNWQQGTLLLRPEENLQIYETMPSGPDVPTLLRPALAALPGRYSETELPPDALQRVHSKSLPLAERELLSKYDPAEKVPGNEARASFPHVSCEIHNDNSNVRITMAHVEVTWRAGGRDHAERWVKPVWIEPASTQRLDVWFGSAVDAAECRLLHARGQFLRKST